MGLASAETLLVIPDEPELPQELLDPLSPEERLDRAAMMYEAAGHNGELRLKAMLEATGALMALLKRDHDPKVIAPVQALFAALGRLATGHADSALRPLRPRGVPGRPGPDPSIKFKQVHVLLAVEVLVRAGWAKGKAYRRVAELASGAGFTGADGKPISEHMVRDWRHRLTGDPQMTDVSAQVKLRVDHLKDHLDKTAAGEAAGLLLKAAAEFQGLQEI